MKPTVTIALFGWPLIALLFFAALPPRRAVIANFVVGWLLLPVAGIGILGFPDVTKASSVAVAALLGVLLFDARRVATFRPRALDLPVLALTAVPLATSLANGLGPYDGLSAVLGNALLWGVPWLMGRLYGSEPGAGRDLVVGLLLGSIAYIPICLFEMRFSPQLNQWLYGFIPFQFGTTRRFGGYRPVGFLRHGIELGMLMMSGSLIGIWLSSLEPRKRLGGIPISWLTSSLILITLLTRALGAWALLAIGASTLFITKATRSGILILLLILTPITYLGARLSGMLQGDELLSLVRNVSDERAASLGARLFHEGRLMTKALERPILGWGGWGRQRIYDESGMDDTLSDGLWIIVFGHNGLVGLVSWLAMLLAAPALVLGRVGARRLLLPSSAPLLVIVVLLPLQTVDWLFNAFVNPVILMMAGSVVEAARPRRRKAARPADPRPLTDPVSRSQRDPEPRTHPVRS